MLLSTHFNHFNDYRSFEAWQKSGAKNLFPVDPNKPLETKPYMQRPGGTPDGKDLQQKGLKGKDQGTAVKLTEIDKKYEQLGQQGQLKSTPFTLPWTNDATAKLNAANSKPNVSNKTSSKSGSKPTPNPVEEPPKKKGLFGLF
jgi:hypothetical protein